MKKVQRTLAAALAAMMLMALAGCSKGDVTEEVNSGLSDLKAQAAEPAVEPQTETPAEPKTDAASEPASEPAAEPEPEATAEPAPASAPADNPDYPSAAGLNTQTLEAFGSDFTLVPATNSFGDFKLFPTDDPSNIFSGDPRILFELQRDLDKINYYYDKFENVEELAPRTIGGVELAGRTYKNVGMWWTEYYGEMPTGGWLSIRISGVDIDPGTEGDTVLNSVTFG